MLTDIDLVSLRRSTRDHIGETTAASWGEPMVDRALNDYYSRLVRKAINADQGYFDTSKTWTLTSNSVTLPRNVWKIRAFLVSRSGSWFPISPINSHRLYYHQARTGDTTHAQVIRFEGDTLVLEPGYSNVEQLKIYYTRVPAPLRYAQAQAGAASTITLDASASVLDDVYIGDEIQIISGTGVGQTRTISDYVGSTNVATVSTAWGTNPDATSYFSTLLASPISRYPELLSVGAAMRLMNKKRDSELWQMLAAQRDEEVSDFVDQIQQRQTDEARYGNYVFQVEDLY